MARKYSCSLRVQVRGASADAPSCSQAFGFPEGMWCLEVAPRGAPGSRGWLSVSLRCLGVRHPAARLPAAVTFRLKHTVAERRDVVKTVAASFSSGEPAVSVAQLKSLDALEGYVKDGHVVVEAELAGADDPEAELAKMVQLPPNEGARQMERMLRSGALSDVTLVARARQQRRHSSSDEPDRPPPPTTRTTKTSEVAERPAEGGGSASQQQQQQQRGGGGAAALLPSDGVEVDVNVRRIPCHRVVLASHSQPLLRMLDPSGPMREASQAEVVLHDTDPQALHAMVQWMYGSPAELPLAKLPTLWQLADLYDVPALRDAVQAEVQRQLSRQPSVAAAVFSLAKGLTPDGPLVELAWGVLCAEEHLQAAATFVDLRWLLDGPDMARLLKAATRVGDKHTCWTGEKAGSAGSSAWAGCFRAAWTGNAHL